MTQDEKLAAILTAVQIDPGSRGLAKDPHDNLFTACPGDFAAACRLLADGIIFFGLTGFPISTSDPVRFETDGPLGYYFLRRALVPKHDWVFPLHCFTEKPIVKAFNAVDQYLCKSGPTSFDNTSLGRIVISIERAGPAADGNCYSMRGAVLNSYLDTDFNDRFSKPVRKTIAIGDGGNEIGMGKIPHETIVKNIPNGDLIHCRVPADYLIVAGVSNWGAYALAAGVFVLRNEKPPSELFDPDLEKRILEIMVREGPLVDGVTGKQTATVDGLSWEEYIAPFNAIREILECD